MKSDHNIGFDEKFSLLIGKNWRKSLKIAENGTYNIDPRPQRKGAWRGTAKRIRAASASYRSNVFS
jgi:hypothetical protein